MWTIHSACDDDSKLTGDACQKDICFCSDVIPGFSSRYAHIDFKVIDGTFYDGSDFVKPIPFFRIPLETWEHAEAHVFVCISSAAFLCGTAWLLAETMPLTVFVLHFRATPFDAVRTTGFFGDSQMLHGEGIIVRTGRIAIIVIPDFLKCAFISGVVRNQGF